MDVYLLKIDEDTGEIVDNFIAVSDANGVATFENIVAGTYFVETESTYHPAYSTTIPANTYFDFTGAYSKIVLP
jgi:hypothetical protein